MTMPTVRRLGKDESTFMFDGSELILNEDKPIATTIIESYDECYELMRPLVFNAIVEYCIRECGLDISVLDSKIREIAWKELVKFMEAKSG
jgi:hypothetical protein